MFREKRNERIKIDLRYRKPIGKSVGTVDEKKG